VGKSVREHGSYSKRERRISTAAGVWEEAVAASMEEKREK